MNKKLKKIFIGGGVVILVGSVLVAGAINVVKHFIKSDDNINKSESESESEYVETEETVGESFYEDEDNKASVSDAYLGFLTTLNSKVRNYCSVNRPSLSSAAMNYPKTIKIVGNQVELTGDFENKGRLGDYQVTLECEDINLNIFKCASSSSTDVDLKSLDKYLQELINHDSTIVTNLKASAQIVNFDKINTDKLLNKAISKLTDEHQKEVLEDRSIVKVFSSSLDSIVDESNNSKQYNFTICIQTTEYKYSIKCSFNTTKHLTGAALINKFTEEAINKNAEYTVSCEQTSEIERALIEQMVAEEQNTELSR